MISPLVSPTGQPESFDKPEQGKCVEGTIFRQCFLDSLVLALIGGLSKNLPSEPCVLPIRNIHTFIAHLRHERRQHRVQRVRSCGTTSRQRAQSSTMP
jgi:thiol:disulfide interchange protein